MRIKYGSFFSGNLKDANQKMLLDLWSEPKSLDKYGLPTIALYTVKKEHSNQFTDGVHLTNEGYCLLVKELVERIFSVADAVKGY